jgi:hypothetical protein
VSKRVNSRAKGIRGELEAVKLWRRWFPDARRSFGQARNGYEQPDIIGGPEQDFYIEVKLCGAPPTNGTIEKWWEKERRDQCAYQKLVGGDKADNLALMWRYDRAMNWTVRIDENTATDLDVVFTITSWHLFRDCLDRIYPIKEV